MTTPLVEEAYEPRRPGAGAQVLGTARDLVALTKPRITALVLTTAAGGLWLAPGDVEPEPGRVRRWLGVALIVGGANALNMYLERDIDGRMERTKDRPLPAGRLAPRWALWFGVVLSVASVPILAIGVNATTALLAVLANLSYVLAYTPMKQRSHWALLVGAVPGAMPPLLGWTAATGKIGAGGLVLFGIMFLWQVPHFLAIALFRREEYARAGLNVAPNTLGVRATKHGIVRYLMALVAVSLLLVPLGIAHRGYLAAAAFWARSSSGGGAWACATSAGNRWARSLFAVSIVYLVLLFSALILERTGLLAVGSALS